jgi:hypothetical protein
MAKKGFFQRGVEFADFLDRAATTLAYNGPKAATERIVRELQQEGPSWTGRFSNSWQISTPSLTKKGSGAPGEPKPLYTPSIRGIEGIKSSALKNTVIFTISNFSPHALEAIDAVEHDRSYWKRPTPEPTTQLGLSKWEVAGPRADVSYRGQIGGGNEGNNSSRTAPLDWFARYASAQLDRAIKIEMDSAIQRRFS